MWAAPHISLQLIARFNSASLIFLLAIFFVFNGSNFAQSLFLHIQKRSRFTRFFLCVLFCCCWCLFFLYFLFYFFIYFIYFNCLFIYLLFRFPNTFMLAWCEWSYLGNTTITTHSFPRFWKKERCSIKCHNHGAQPSRGTKEREIRNK